MKRYDFDWGYVGIEQREREDGDWVRYVDALAFYSKELDHAYAEGRKDESESMSQAAREVLAERQRQIEQEGYTPEHDGYHDQGEIVRAAMCYADVYGFLSEGEHQKLWPWGATAWKPKGVHRDLVRAAALILAELERRQRAGRV